MIRLTAVSLLAVLALTATSAQAKTIHATSILSKDGKVSCYGSVPAEGRMINCTSPGLGKSHGVPRYAQLRPTGTTRITARSDYGGYNGRPKTIRPGDRWVWKGIVCTYGSMGLNCNNTSDHGFLIDDVSFTKH
jgi:hypothetical protein